MTTLLSIPQEEGVVLVPEEQAAYTQSGTACIALYCVVHIRIGATITRAFLATELLANHS